jgi:hypothetical protein
MFGDAAKSKSLADVNSSENSELEICMRSISLWTIRLDINGLKYLAERRVFRENSLAFGDKGMKYQLADEIKINSVLHEICFSFSSIGD